MKFERKTTRRRSRKRHHASGPHVEFVKDGEWIEPTPPEAHTLICCDCGLVHSVDFRIEDGHVQFRPYRDEAQSTAWRAAHPDLPMQVAAPEVLDALRTLVSQLDVDCTDRELGQAFMDAWDAAEAAIAKAT